MKTFIWVILVGIGGYIGGLMTGGVVKIIADDIWILVKGSVLTIVEVFRKIFGRQ